MTRHAPLVQRHPPSPRHTTEHAWLWFGAFVICTLVMYGPLLIGSKFLWFDAVDISMVKVWLTCRSLAAGHLPLWDPCIHGGHPVLGDQTYAVFYPFHLALAALGLLSGSVTLGYINFAVVMETLWAGAGVFVLGRRVLGFSALAAFVAATVFIFSLPAVGHVLQYVHYTEIVMIPWMLVGVMGLRTGSLSYVACVAALWAMTLLGNNLQYSYFMAMAVGLWALVDLVATWREQRRVGAVVVLLAKYSVVFALGIAIAAIDLAPKLEFTRTMEPRPKEALAASGTPLVYAVTYLVPGWFGTVKGGPAPYYGRAGFWNYYEYAHYVGVVALVLAGIGLWKMPRTRVWWFLVILLLFGWGYAYGTNNPLPTLLPLGAMFRIPAKFLVFNACALALLAGFAVHMIASRAIPPASLKHASHVAAAVGMAVILILWTATAMGSRQPAQEALIAQGLMVAGFLIALTCGVLWTLGVGRLPAPWAAVVLALLAAADIIGHTRPFCLASHNPELGFPYAPDPYITAWQREMTGGVFRISGGPAFEGRMRGTYFGLHTLEGNMAGLIRWLCAVGRCGGGTNMDRMLDLHNVKYAVVIDERGVRVVERSTYLPRAFAVHCVEVAAESNIIARLYERAFDPRTTMLVTPEFADLDSTATNATPDRVTITRYADEHIEIAADMGAPGYVVLSENRYPGWEARVDGVRARIIHANYAFRAVRVPEGRHTVAWSYRPQSLRIGAAISAGAVAVCAAGAFLPWLMRRISLCRGCAA